MVVGHDIAVRADDDAGAAALALASVATAEAFVAEEETEERVDLLLLALLGLDGHLDVDDRLDGVLRGIGEVGIITQ